MKKMYQSFLNTRPQLLRHWKEGVKVIQICTEPTLQVYTPFIYKGISIKQINKNIFEYNQIKKLTYQNVDFKFYFEFY